MYSEDALYWQWYLAIWIVWAAAAGLIGAKCGGSGLLWFIVGLFLGPFALPLPFLLAGRLCPFCRKGISRDASICPYCRSELVEQTTETEEHNAEDEKLDKSPGVVGPLLFGLFCASFILFLVFIQTR